MNHLPYGAFDSIRIEQGTLIRVSQHLQRFLATLTFLKCDFSFSEQDLLERSLQFLSETSSTSELEKLNIFFDETDGLSFKRSPIPQQTSLTLSLERDPYPRSLLDEYKTLGYTRSRLLKKQHPQTDDCLFFDEHGYMLESSFANVCFFKNETLYCPKQEGIFPGIMQKYLLEFAKKQHKQVESRPIHTSELAHFDEIFLCNSVREIISVNEVVHSPLKSGEQTQRFFLEFKA